MTSARERWNARYSDSELVWSKAPNALVQEHASGLKLGKGLDIACGEGRNAIWLARQGWQMTAFDFSDAGIARAAQIADHRGVVVDWLCADLCDFDYGHGQYDLVVACFVHTCAKQRETWLPRAISAINRGGTFLYVGHDPDNIEYGVGGPQDATVLPGPAQVVASLDGFDVILAETVKRDVAGESGHGASSGTALDTLVVARRD